MEMEDEGALYWIKILSPLSAGHSAVHGQKE